MSFANANHTYVDVPDSPSLHVDTTFTLEAWIYQTAAQYNGYRLIDKITAGVGGGFLFDTYDPNGSGHRLRLCGTGGCAYSNVLYSLNQWHHVAAVVAGSMATIYLDGQQVGSGTVGGGGSQANTLDLHIGAPHVGCGGGCGTSEYFNGTIDEVRIWNVARTQQQIQGAINSSLTGAESGLVGYWRFDDGSGTRTADTSGHNNNGTLVNSPTWVSSTAPIGPPPTTFVPGAPNVAAAAALTFGGMYNNFVDVPNSANFDFPAGLTIEAWIYQTQAQSNGYRVVDKTTAGGGEGSFILDTYDPNGSGRRLRFCASSGCIDGSTTYSLNQWHHVAAVVAGTSATLYLDGQPNGSGTVGPIQTSTLDVYIGAPHVGCGGSCGLVEYFNGTIDEVRLWNIARPQQQIQQAMYGSLTGHEAGLVGYWRFNEGSGPTTADASGHNNTGLLVNRPTWVNSTAPLGMLTAANVTAGGNSTINQTFCQRKAVANVNDPVNCATGDFYNTFTDLSVPGRGIPLAFSRTYNSLAANQDSPVGYGWTDSYNASLSTDVSGVITVTEGNGSSVTFSPDGSGGYQAPSRVLATLTRNADGTLTLIRNKDQQQLTYTAPTTTTVGHLIKQVDRNGYTTSLGYDGNGHLTTVTDPAGRSLMVSYNAAGRIASVSDPINRSVAFAYDASGNLTAVTDVGGGVTQFGYYPGTHLLNTITDPKGNVLTMAYDPSGRVTSVTDPLKHAATMSYVANADGTQTNTMTDTNGNVTVEQYLNNELLSKTDGYGTPQQTTWTYTYDPATLGVASVTDPNGHTSDSTYDSRGNQLSHTDPLGRTTSYAYDTLNDTTAITDPLGVTTAMTYDVAGNLLQTARPLTQTNQVALTTLAYDPAHPGDVLAKTDPNGHMSHYAYDAYGNLTSASDPAGDTTSYGYDLIGRKTSVVDPRGNAPGANPISYTTTMTYDAFGQTTAITDPLGRVTADQYDANQNLITATDPLGHQTIYGYDANNHHTSIERPDGTILSTGYDPAGNVVTQTDALGRSTITAYDALNRVSSVTDPLNRATTTQYDLAGNVITTTDPLGHQTVYGYDAANERTSVQYADSGIDQAVYDLDGRVSRRLDPLNHGTVYGYDSLGRLTSVADPLARTTVYTYDLGGNKTALADPAQRLTTYQYDAADRLITTTNPLSGTTVLGYDPAGNTIAKTDANGHTTRQIYDADNELTKVVRPDQGVLLTQYDADGNAITKTNTMGHNTIYGYDLLNRLTSTTDPREATTTYQYDANSNVITTTDALNHQTIASYNADDEKTQVRQADGSLLRTAYDATGNVITQTDALTRSTVYGYDAMNRVITTTDPLTRTTVYTYDIAGNKTALTDSMGRTTQYGYDAGNELTSINYSDGTTPNVAYTYTATGQRQSMADGTGTTTYQYDALDRPITVTNGAGQSVGYGYDAVGNVTALTYPDASAVTRTYDALDRLSGVADWLGHTTQFGYDANSNLITETLPNTTSVVQGYNAADQLTAITDTQVGSPLWSYGYGRDLLGQVTTSADPLDGKVHSYGYSPLDQLTSDQQGNGAITTTASWSPNAAQEITQQVNQTGSTTTTSTYDLAHELTGLQVVSGTTPTQNTTLTYNGDGDRTGQADSISGANTTYGYDQADRLSAAISTTNGITTATYSYDGDGLRQSKIVTTTQGTTTTVETWDAAGGLPTLLQDGATRYVAGPDGLPLEQIDANGHALYYLHDQLGSTRALLDGSGRTVATYTYDPYGNVTGKTGSATTPVGFAGEYTDAEAGLQYLRARYYDPATSQFLSVDPLESLTKQPYAYVGDDPLNTLDPTGLKGCNGSSGQDFWARGASSIGDFGCNLGEVKDFVLTRQANGTTSALANEIPSLILGPATVAGGPSGPCDFAAYDAQANRDQQTLDQQANNAAIVSTAVGSAGLARGVAGFAGGFIRGLRGPNAIIDAGKYDYLFGRVASNAHNTQRSAQNLAQMTRLGVEDTSAGRALLQGHLEAVVRDPSNIVETFTDKYGTYQVRESLFAGPSGAFAKLESTWEVLPDGSLRLTSIIPKGGRKGIFNPDRG